MGNYIRTGNTVNITAVIIMLLLLIWGFFAATTAEAWYSGSHDAQHEGPDCKCYERLVAADKEKVNDRI